MSECRAVEDMIQSGSQIFHGARVCDPQPFLQDGRKRYTGDVLRLTEPRS